MQQAPPNELFREAYWAAETGNPDLAIEIYGQLLGTALSPADASVAHMNRGNAYLAQQEDEKALKDYARALEANPRNAGAYANTAAVALKRKEFDAVIAACTQATELDPRMGEAYINRAEAYQGKGELPRAVADLKKAIALEGNRLEVACNQLAWIRATSLEKSLRNGKEAVAAATRACELTKWQNPGVLDTLAAAYAEHGQFAQAVEAQARALAFDKLLPDIRQEMEHRLEQYKRGEAYREAPKS
jgi:tetratricopeptide (TPR) repeat protein